MNPESAVSPSSSPALLALRARTRSLHEAVEHCTPLSVEQAGLAEYLAHLERLYGWLAGVEAWLAQAVTWPQDWRPRFDQAALIATDLAAAGRPLPPVVPLRYELPDVADSEGGKDALTAYAFGVLYVVEGSRLGAQVLLRQLQGRAGNHPLAYLHGSGEHGQRWRAFLVNLAAQVQTMSQIAPACEGAAAAFGSLLEQMRDRSHAQAVRSPATGSEARAS